MGSDETCEGLGSGDFENWSSKSYSCHIGSRSRDLRSTDLQVVVSSPRFGSNTNSDRCKGLALAALMGFREEHLLPDIRFASMRMQSGG